MQKQKFSITDILNKAEQDNEKQRSEEYPVNEVSSVVEKPVVKENSQLSGDKKEPAHLKKEAEEIIGKYSQKSHVTLDEKTSTDALRESLNTQMANDKELFNYYRSFENRKKSRKVEELYNLINYATQSDIEERETLVVTEDTKESHFTEHTEKEQEKKYKQQKFYDFGETQAIPVKTADKSAADKSAADKSVADKSDTDKPVAEYDEDYDALSGKIESGEINFIEENNDGQISMINDEPAVKPLKPAVKPLKPAVRSSTPAVNNPELDEKDINLRLVFGMLDEKTPIPEKIKNEAEKVKKAKKEKKKQNEPIYEYVNRSQNSEIQEMLTKAVHSSLVKLIIALLFCGCIAYMELGAEISSLYAALNFLERSRNGMFYAVELLVLCFLIMTLLDSVIKGAAGLFSRKPNSESVLFVSFAVAFLHSVITILINGSDFVKLYCLPCAVIGVCSAFIKYLQCRKDYHCFKVVASTRSKYVAEKLTGNTKEAEEFYKYLFDDSEIYTTKKTDFVEGFFRRIHTRPESESINGFIIALALIVSGVLFGLSMYEGSTFYESYTMFTLTLAFSLPFSSFFIIALPVIAANRVGKKNGSAFIGNAVGEEYADASVISFSDTEVYPANLVKITSIKVYGEYRIDRIINDLTQVFSFVGGPLKSVTGSMITGEITPPSNPKLIESASDGICVVIDGREMFLGKRNYLRRYRFEAPYDEADAAYEKKNGSVMYVTLNDTLIAKVYVRYTLNPQFNSLLRDLYKAGMCVGIKTTDPNITNSLIESSVKYKKTPISILKAGDVSDVDAESEKTDSGIVVNASLHTFLKMFIVSDKIRHVTKANGIISMLSLAIAFFVAFFLSYTGQMIGLPSWYPVMFQLIWLVPVGIVSFLL